MPKRKRTNTSSRKLKKQKTMAPFIPTTSLELKVFDVTLANSGVNTTSSISCINLPVLGTDFTQRIGRKTVTKSIHIRGYLLIEYALTNAIGGAPGQMARMIILNDLQPNGALPVITDILAQANPTAHLNLNNRDRFRVIIDKQWALDPYTFNTTATTSQSSQGNVNAFNVYRKVNIPTIFNATNGGTIADINTGALILVWIGSVVAGATDSNALHSTRIRFYDA